MCSFKKLCLLDELMSSWDEDYLSISEVGRRDRERQSMYQFLTPVLACLPFCPLYPISSSPILPIHSSASLNRVWILEGESRPEFVIIES